MLYSSLVYHISQFRATHYYPPLYPCLWLLDQFLNVQISSDFSNFTNMSILFPSTNPFDPPNLPFIRRCCTACAKTSQTGVCGSRSVPLWVCFLVPFRCFVSFMCVANADWLLLDDELNIFFAHPARYLHLSHNQTLYIYKQSLSSSHRTIS